MNISWYRKSKNIELKDFIETSGWKRPHGDEEMEKV